MCKYCKCGRLYGRGSRCKVINVRAERVDRFSAKMEVDDVSFNLSYGGHETGEKLTIYTTVSLY